VGSISPWGCKNLGNPYGPCFFQLFIVYPIIFFTRKRSNLHENVTVFPSCRDKFSIEWHGTRWFSLFPVKYWPFRYTLGTKTGDIHFLTKKEDNFSCGWQKKIEFTSGGKKSPEDLCHILFSSMQIHFLIWNALCGIENGCFDGIAGLKYVVCI